jgi:acetylornithine/N-succinyldiaminopimelate aminotransferase
MQDHPPVRVGRPAGGMGAMAAVFRRPKAHDGAHPFLRLPRSTSSPLSLLPTYVRAPEVFVRGEGARLFDQQGHAWLDLLGGIAVSALGHNHPGLTAALREQVGQVLHVSNLYRHPAGEEAAERLARLSGMRGVFFSNSGAEANEAALKLARKYQRSRQRPERTGFVALEGGFHGRTCGALSVTHAARYREPFEPLLGPVHWVAPNDVDALTAAIRERQPAALILEPIQGEGGIRPLTLEFLEAARSVCTETETVLIHDEVQSGCGRTGSFLAGDRAGVKPDLATLAKPLGAGIPIGALLVAEAFADVLVPGDHGSTFGGGPLAARAACVFLREWEEGDLPQRVALRGAQLERALSAFAVDNACVRERRGRGLMQALVMDSPERAQALVSELHRRRVLCCVAGGHAVRFLPPYVITEAELEEALDAVQSALAAIENNQPSTDKALAQ